MAYVTKQQLIDRFGNGELVQLTDRTNRPATTIDDTAVSAAIADAEALIDGYVGKIYALPVTPVPPVLTRTAADLARYYLHGKTAETDGPVHRAYKEALRWLTDVSRGLVQLDAAGVAAAPAGGGAVRTVDGTRVFTRDSLRSM